MTPFDRSSRISAAGFATGDSNEAHNRLYWQGTQDELITSVLRPAYQETKRVDPALQVVGPDTDVPSHLQQMLSTASDCFDIIAIHAYPWGTPSTVFDFQGWVNRLDGGFLPIIHSLGRGKLVWLTETGWWRDGFSGTPQTSGYQQMLSALAARPWIHRVFFYRGWAAEFGLVLWDQSVLPPPAPPPVSTPALSTIAAHVDAVEPLKPRDSISASLQSQMLAHISAGSSSGGGSHCVEAANCSDYILIMNANYSQVVARVTYVRDDGSTKRIDYSVPARGRIGLAAHAEAGVAGGGDVSVAVQSLSAGLPLHVEHASYWGGPQTFRAGRSTEARSPSPTWYFAEGLTGSTLNFVEYISIFNPSDAPVNIAIRFLPPSGAEVQKVVHIPHGPGRATLRVNDLVGQISGPHGTTLTATSAATGALVGIVAERTIVWGSGRYEGHSSSGSNTLSTTWYFAEGGQQNFFSNYLLI